MILQANSPEVAMHVLRVDHCRDDFFAEVKTEVTVLFEKRQFCSDAHFDNFVLIPLLTKTESAPGASASVH